MANRDDVKLIEDVLMYPLKVNRDDTGILIETLRSDWKEIYGEGREFAMQYFSITPSGIARDENTWHIHNGQEDRFLVVQGEIIVAVADNREGSRTKGLLNLFHMKPQENPYILLIPRHVLHGFMVISKSEAILLNFPTQLYNPNDEVRVPHEKALVKFSDGSNFTWEEVRQFFNLNGKK